jgi:hypothetical protein
MANTIEIIIKATDQASAIVEKTEAKIVASNTAIIKSYDAVSKTRRPWATACNPQPDVSKIGQTFTGLTPP